MRQQIAAAGARGLVDAVILPEDTRETLSLALRTAMENPGPHIGPFGVPTGIPQ